ncbi:hypothetical protein ABE494_06265 [Stenotrophomonas lactitubi]|uniref:hypothetical protein n=1 Tax=Stenotrophomonas lactitubi TaxID=2045214 RepID=UPI003209C204
MSVIEIIRTKQGKEFKQILRRDAFSHILFDGGQVITITLNDGTSIELVTPNDAAAQTVYSDLLIALKQAIGVPSTITYSLL